MVDPIFVMVWAVVGSFLGVVLAALLVFNPMMRHFFKRIYSEKEEIYKLIAVNKLTGRH